MKQELSKIIEMLNDFKGEEHILLKIYFVDKDNYCFKFIDTRTNTKVHTIRRNQTPRLKSLDNNWWDKKTY